MQTRVNNAVIDAQRANLLSMELERFVDVVVPTLSPEKILVFGSAAHGRISEWSDLDIVVIMETALSFLDRIRTVQRLVQPRFAMDILVYTPREWDDVSVNRPFVRDEIAAKGRVVYDRASQTMA